MGMKYWFSLGMRKKPKSPSSAPSPLPSPPNPSSASASPMQQAGGLRQLFDNFDADGDGRISAADLASLLSRVGGGSPGPACDVAASMLWAADLDGDGFISLEEFGSVCCGEEARREEELRTAFEVYDRNGDGVISAEELHHVLKGVMGKGAVTLAECRGMIRAVDCDGDDAVSFDEFAGMMTRTSLT